MYGAANEPNTAKPRTTADVAPDAAAHLLALGFSQAEIARLCTVRDRFPDQDRGATLDENRLRFARWLVEHGRLSEQPESGAGA